MAGWELKSGELKNLNPSEDELWSSFNFVFSDASKKRNTYKFGLIKSILDNLFDAIPQPFGDAMEYFISYDLIFTKFAGNYWNLITKYHLHQMRQSTTSQYSEIEQIFMKAASESPEVAELEFDSVEEHSREKLISYISQNCRKYVLGALYEDLNGTVYSFDLKGQGIFISNVAYDFLSRFKMELEKLNYYSWAKFLEKINDDAVLVRVIDKLDLATPLRNDLSIYRLVLQKEFEENTCFYCGKKLTGTAAVDHVIPWSFVKTDNLWNFVLSCQSCNSKKNNKLPDRDMVARLLKRNEAAKKIEDPFVVMQFRSYSPKRFQELCRYAAYSGYRTMTI